MSSDVGAQIDKIIAEVEGAEIQKTSSKYRGAGDLKELCTNTFEKIHKDFDTVELSLETTIKQSQELKREHDEHKEMLDDKEFELTLHTKVTEKSKEVEIGFCKT